MLGIDIIVGAVTGLLGSIVTGYTNIKTQKMKNEHEVAMIDAETKAMIAETQANIQIIKTEVEGKIDLQDAQTYAIGQKEGNKDLFKSAYIKWLMNDELPGFVSNLMEGGKVARFFGTIIGGFLTFVKKVIGITIIILFASVDVLKAFIRPGVTIYFTGIMTWITWMAWDIMQKSGMNITATEAVTIWGEVIFIVKYLTVTCICWWFADRRTAKFLMRLSDNNIKE